MKRDLRKYASAIAILLGIFMLTGPAAWSATEPEMANYTSYPVFMSGQIPPNIMVMLDNSGSMNYNAYGTWKGENKYVTGEPFNSSYIEVRIDSSLYDVEERNGGYLDNDDLDMGNFFSSHADKSYVGLLFKNLAIPKGAIITNAYLEFTALVGGGDESPSDPAETKFLIKAQATDHAENFINEAFGISARPTTAASATWGDIPIWTAGNTYQTPDLSDVIQEIVDRAGWNSGQAMAFIITGDGKRDASPRNVDEEHAPKLYVEYSYPYVNKEYYGYFDPASRYSYANSIFSRDPNGAWSGNFLNWLTMRRIDVARKVLMGGLANPRTYSGTLKLNGEGSEARFNYRRWYDGTIPYNDGSTIKKATPHSDDEYDYRMEGNTLSVYDKSGTFKASYKIVVEKVAAEEPQDFADLDGAGPTTVGVFQRYGSTGRWGNMWFNNDGTGKGGNGGVIKNGISDTVTSSFVTDLQNTSATTWTPLAESLYTAAKYFAQESIDSNLEYLNNPGTTAEDPFDGAEYCAKNFVLLITDGASTMDDMIPGDLKDYADDYDTFVTSDSWSDENCVEGDKEKPCKYANWGTDYLKDVALWARTKDLRGDIESKQNIILYTVYAFGNEESARELLKEAAKNGGFKDRNNNGKPDGGKDDAPDAKLEWDENGDGLPDTYFEAQNGGDLQKALGKAIADMGKRASSGTASSVLATNSEGEATLVQAYFRPSVPQKNHPLTWVGYMHSLWVDKYGNLREDTDGDLQLDMGSDLIVEYYNTGTEDGTAVRRYTSHPAYTGDSETSTSFVEISMEAVKPLFEVGNVLADTNPDDRDIFTLIDPDEDPETADSVVVKFTKDNAATLAPYLGVKDAVAYDHLGASHTERVDNLINYIRGIDLFDSTGNPVLRTRTLEENTDTGESGNRVWKLGDIVHSTPVTVAEPMDNYGVIYSDESYLKYYEKVKDRENIVVVGANDGMLHAFTSWKYDDDAKKFERPAVASEDEVIGTELWAYIPQSLLPHLKWLSDPDYTHVYYADLQAKIVDAQILPDTDADEDEEKDWGTFLLLGLNMGGKQIWSNEFGATGTDIRYFNPSYTCINITDPRKPVVMWEREYSGLGLGTSVPNVIKTNDNWMMVFGSGPTNYNGTSIQNAHVFVVDLATGKPYTNSGSDWLYELDEDNAFLNSPVSVDKGLNYSVDGIYFGETYCEKQCDDPNNFDIGMAYKIPVPCSPCEWDNDGKTMVEPVYVEEPTTWPGPVVLLKSDNTYSIPPLTGTMTISTDKVDNIWIYFGTGRYIDESDKSTIQQNYLFGVKDPFFNQRHSTSDSDLCEDCYHNYGKALELTPSLLFDSESVDVAENGMVFKADSSTLFTLSADTTAGAWGTLIAATRQTEGWMRALDMPNSTPSERCISKPGLLGGIVLVPVFEPIPDICEAGGTTSFYGLYYETGTAYKKNIFSDLSLSPKTKSYDNKVLDVNEVKLGSTYAGTPPPTSGIHVGAPEDPDDSGSKAFIQLSTGEIMEVDFDTALKIRSNIINWRLMD